MDLKNYKFVGLVVKEEELASYYKTADMFVLPSVIREFYDGWGMVINEAMSLGNPIITTDAVGSSLELVKNGVNGFVVKNGDLNELTNALQKLIENPNPDDPLNYDICTQAAEFFKRNPMEEIRKNYDNGEEITKEKDEDDIIKVDD